EQVTTLLHQPTHRQVPGRVGAREDDNVQSVELQCAIDELHRLVDDPADGDAGAHDVVAATVEGDQVRVEGERRLELLGDDRTEFASADREVGVPDRFVG